MLVQKRNHGKIDLWRDNFEVPAIGPNPRSLIYMRVEGVEVVDGKIGKIKLLGFSGGTGIMSAGGHYL